VVAVRSAPGAVAWLLLALWLAAPAVAQEDVSDIFKDLGTASTVDEGDEGGALESEDLANAGKIRGRVLDGDTGAPIRDATVILIWPAPADGGQPRQEVQTTDFDGEYEFAAVPAGAYTLNFVKAGFRASTMTDFQVEPQKINRADFPMPPIPTGTSSEILQLDAFVVEASTVEEMMSGIELRLDSDSLLNTFSAEDFSRFAASDVADALKRVAGVNIVEGQFAIIRGLEDRYSSTLYNSAVVPSPDPDRQSPQLDLFASEIVGNLAIFKSFTPELPSNSSGGSIDIQTTSYPEEFEFKLTAATGFNDNAIDKFLEFQDQNPVGKKIDGEDTLTQEFGASFGGRREFFGRDFRIKGVFNYQVDYQTEEGFREAREPRRSNFALIPAPGRFTETGDLSIGELNLSGGRFDLTESTREEQFTYFGAAGFDIDEDQNHRIDFSGFYTNRTDEIVQIQENGYIPNFDYGELRRATLDGDELNQSAFDGFATFGAWITEIRESQFESPQRGPLWYSSFQQATSQRIKRDLLITQLNGDHDFGHIKPLEGLRFRWAGNYAKTTQEDDSYGARYWYEPCGFSPEVPCPQGYTRDATDIPTSFPVTPGELGPGVYAASRGVFTNSNDIDEKQWFARGDADYERKLVRNVDGKVSVGGWYEYAKRKVDSSFLDTPTVGNIGQFSILGATPSELGENIFAPGVGLDRDGTGLIAGTRVTKNDSKREIAAGAFQGKITLFEDVDLIGGVRLEDIVIESNNDPFTGFPEFDGSPEIFPNKYLQADRLDNPTRNEVGAPPDSDTTFNDQLLNIDVPVDRTTDVCDPPDKPNQRRGCVDLITASDIDGFVNGKIDETKVLPAAGITYRPIDGLSIRGAYSQTVARPSFREMGFYVSVDIGSNDLVIGNPQLGLSDVESWDGRLEYVWGETGDLVAFSGFYKTIENPIESVLLRDPLNFDDSSAALFQTFFNNPNDATLWGIEVEARKSLDFFGVDFLKYFSLGGNFTYIDAEVKRSEVELQRSQAFFGVVEGTKEKFSSLNKKRRLFGQPEWIANADITFKHPDWGTTITFAYFGISDVLDATGSAVLGRSGNVESGTIDRYVDEFYQLDLVTSQQFALPRDLGVFTLKFRVKNLTDTKRQLVYDTDQTSDQITERSVKIGRDFKFTLGYTYTF
jgi:TonB-dependent receptor